MTGVLMSREPPLCYVRLSNKRVTKRYNMSQVFRRTSEDLWSTKRDDGRSVHINCTMALLEQADGDYWISLYAVNSSEATFSNTVQLASTFGIPESCNYDPVTKVSRFHLAFRLVYNIR